MLVTTLSDRQADTQLPVVAMAALATEPVHVVATYPSGVSDGIAAPGNATVHRFVPPGVVLDRAVAAITHGGMGSTQKAFACGVPVCVVPYGRDQFEVARRVEVARCGNRLTAKKLSPARLKVKALEAMSMTTGAQRVADEFKSNRRRRPRRRLDRATTPGCPALKGLPAVAANTGASHGPQRFKTKPALS